MKTSFFLCFSLKRAGLELETNMATLIGIMKTISREADTKEKGTYDRVVSSSSPALFKEKQRKNEVFID
jgi:hypothetical protein